MTATTINTFQRSTYGEILPLRNFDKSYNTYLGDIIAEASCMIAQAVKSKKIDKAYDYISWDRKKRAEGDALHHELYDVSEDGRHCLVCLRSTQGNGKYGVSTTSKDYVIISQWGAGVKVVEAPKAKAAKAAKQAKNPGDAIMVCLGKKKLTTPQLEKTTCYKIAVWDEDEGFISVYDSSSWSLGKTRTERSTMNHRGGYYVFPSVESALEAWSDRVVFTPQILSHRKKYALLECECSGRAYQHDSGKICISRVKPVNQVASLLY